MGRRGRARAVLWRSLAARPAPAGRGGRAAADGGGSRPQGRPREKPREGREARCGAQGRVLGGTRAAKHVGTESSEVQEGGGPPGARAPGLDRTIAWLPPQ
ncbi:unnamed protein product, partial [Prorocentrum cordatum]